MTPCVNLNRPMMIRTPHLAPWTPAFCHFRTPPINHCPSVPSLSSNNETSGTCASDTSSPAVLPTFTRPRTEFPHSHDLTSFTDAPCAQRQNYTRLAATSLKNSSAQNAGKTFRLTLASLFSGPPAANLADLSNPTPQRIVSSAKWVSAARPVCLDVQLRNRTRSHRRLRPWNRGGKILHHRLHPWNRGGNLPHVPRPWNKGGLTPLRFPLCPPASSTPSTKS